MPGDGRQAHLRAARGHPGVPVAAWPCFSLIATRHTARLVRDKVGLEVEEPRSGPEGGDAQIAARVATGAVDAVFFFVDPL
ncbi:MAG TPA: hypothetical protein VFX28_24345, partial [Methylomirabilota bacterium]|nr:hypothetical protein [Methylomirabilota bacterium]